MQAERRSRRTRMGEVRSGDIEPYTALRWVSTLFKSAAVFLIIAVIAEFVAGIRVEGWAALPVLLGELARTLVFAIVLWGGGDLVRLMIDIGHDVRADRVLLARLVQRTEATARGAVEGRDHGRFTEKYEPRRNRGPEAAAD